MDHVSADDLLRAPLLAPLPTEMREELAQRFQIEEFAPGRTVVREGVAGYAFYLIDRGTVNVTLGGVALRSLGPGDFFGEISILREGRRTATVTAVDEVVTWTLFGTAFRVLQADRRDVSDALEAAMKARLAAS
jgi:CRP-like cAMP-binding protein